MSKIIAGATKRPSSGPAASTCNCWASAATGTSASTSPSACATAARGWPRSTRSRAGTRPAISSAKRTCRTQAMTMGIGTILDARKMILIALGEHKAAHRPRSGRRRRVSDRVPASFLREHPDASFLLDAAAAVEAHRRRHALGAGQRRVDRRLIKQAVLWLSQQTEQGAAEARRPRFSRPQPAPAAAAPRPGQAPGARVFRWMMDTIEYHPAGREPSGSSASARTPTTT